MPIKIKHKTHLADPYLKNSNTKEILNPKGILKTQVNPTSTLKNSKGFVEIYELKGIYEKKCNHRLVLCIKTIALILVTCLIAPFSKKAGENWPKIKENFQFAWNGKKIIALYIKSANQNPSTSNQLDQSVEKAEKAFLDATKDKSKEEWVDEVPSDAAKLLQQNPTPEEQSPPNKSNTQEKDSEKEAGKQKSEEFDSQPEPNPNSEKAPFQTPSEVVSQQKPPAVGHPPVNKQKTASDSKKESEKEAERPVSQQEHQSEQAKQTSSSTVVFSSSVDDLDIDKLEPDQILDLVFSRKTTDLPSSIAKELYRKAIDYILKIDFESSDFKYSPYDIYLLVGRTADKEKVGPLLNKVHECLFADIKKKSNHIEQLALVKEHAKFHVPNIISIFNLWPNTLPSWQELFLPNPKEHLELLIKLHDYSYIKIQDLNSLKRLIVQPAYNVNFDLAKLILCSQGEGSWLASSTDADIYLNILESDGTVSQEKIPANVNPHNYLEDVKKRKELKDAKRVSAEILSIKPTINILREEISSNTRAHAREKYAEKIANCWHIPENGQNKFLENIQHNHLPNMSWYLVYDERKDANNGLYLILKHPSLKELVKINLSSSRRLDLEAIKKLLGLSENLEITSSNAASKLSHLMSIGADLARKRNPQEMKDFLSVEANINNIILYLEFSKHPIASNQILKNCLKSTLKREIANLNDQTKVNNTPYPCAVIDLINGLLASKRTIGLNDGKKYELKGYQEELLKQTSPFFNTLWGGGFGEANKEAHNLEDVDLEAFSYLLSILEDKLTIDELGINQLLNLIVLTDQRPIHDDKITAIYKKAIDGLLELDFSHDEIDFHALEHIYLILKNKIDYKRDPLQQKIFDCLLVELKKPNSNRLELIKDLPEKFGINFLVAVLNLWPNTIPSWIDLFLPNPEEHLALLIELLNTGTVKDQANLKRLIVQPAYNIEFELSKFILCSKGVGAWLISTSDEGLCINILESDGTVSQNNIPNNTNPLDHLEMIKKQKQLEDSMRVCEKIPEIHVEPSIHVSKIEETNSEDIWNQTIKLYETKLKNCWFNPQDGKNEFMEYLQQYDKPPMSWWLVNVEGQFSINRLYIRIQHPLLKTPIEINLSSPKGVINLESIKKFLKLSDGLEITIANAAQKMCPEVESKISKANMSEFLDHKKNIEKIFQYLELSNNTILKKKFFLRNYLAKKLKTALENQPDDGLYSINDLVPLNVLFDDIRKLSKTQKYLSFLSINSQLRLFEYQDEFLKEISPTFKKERESPHGTTLCKVDFKTLSNAIKLIEGSLNINHLDLKQLLNFIYFVDLETYISNEKMNTGPEESSLVKNMESIYKKASDNSEHFSSYYIDFLTLGPVYLKIRGKIGYKSKILTDVHSKVFMKNVINCLLLDLKNKTIDSNLQTIKGLEEKYGPEFVANALVQFIKKQKDSFSKVMESVEKVFSVEMMASIFAYWSLNSIPNEAFTKFPNLPFIKFNFHQVVFIKNFRRYLERLNLYSLGLDVSASEIDDKKLPKLFHDLFKSQFSHGSNSGRSLEFLSQYGLKNFWDGMYGPLKPFFKDPAIQMIMQPFQSNHSAKQLFSQLERFRKEIDSELYPEMTVDYVNDFGYFSRKADNIFSKVIYKFLKECSKPEIEMISERYPNLFEKYFGKNLSEIISDSKSQEEKAFYEKYPIQNIFYSTFRNLFVDAYVWDTYYQTIDSTN